MFARDEVEYVGFEITMDSVKPASSMLQAIKEFPAPTNITQIRSFFGLVNKVSFETRGTRGYISCLRRQGRKL